MKTVTIEQAELMSPILALSIPNYDLPKLPPVLTPKEFDRLVELEKEFELLKPSFQRASEIMLEIRDKQLWRQDFKSFQDYCVDKLGITARRGRQLADSAKVLKNLQEVTEGTEKPKNERQVRALAPLPAEEQREVWKEVSTKAKDENREVTGKDVERAVQERREPGFKLESEDNREITANCDPEQAWRDALKKNKGLANGIKFSAIQIDAWIDVVCSWLKPGAELSVAKIMGHKRNSFNVYQAPAIFDEMVERGLVKEGVYVGKAEEVDGQVEKLAKKIYAIAVKEAGIDRPWKMQSEQSQRFVIEIARWHLGEILSLAKVAKETEDAYEKLREQYAQLTRERTAGIGVGEVRKTAESAEKRKDKWPRPNVNGVFSKSDAENIEFKHKQLHAVVSVLQVSAKKWIAATDYSFRTSGGSASPLTADKTFPDRESAIEKMAWDLRDSMVKIYKGKSAGMHSIADREAAKKCAEWFRLVDELPESFVICRDIKGQKPKYWSGPNSWTNDPHKAKHLQRKAAGARLTATKKWDSCKGDTMVRLDKAVRRFEANKL